MLLSKQTLKNSFCLKTKQTNTVVVNKNVTPLSICARESCAAPESCAKNDRGGKKAGHARHLEISWLGSRHKKPPEQNCLLHHTTQFK